MPRNTRRKSVTIGVFGLAEVPPKTIPDLLDDALTDVEATFIIPVTTEHDTPSMRAVLKYLADNDIDFEAVTTSGKLPLTLRNVVSEAAVVHKASDVGTAIVNRLSEDDDARLYVFFDSNLEENEDGGAYNAITYAEDNEVPSYDFANGLSPFDFGDDDDGPKDSVDAGAGPEEDDDEPEEEPVKRVRKAVAPAVEEEDEETVMSEDDLAAYEDAKSWGPRKLRDTARSHLGLKPGTAKWREIGSMSKDEVLDLLYPAKTETAEPVSEYHQTTLEEQIAAATHASTAALPTQLNGDVAVAFGQFWYLLAKEVAAQTVAEMIKRDLVDA